MKAMDGIELLTMIRDGKLNIGTKIKSISASGNEYIFSIFTLYPPKIIYESGVEVSLGYLTNKDNTFKIIEEDKKIEEIKWNEKSLYNGNTTRKLDVMLMSRTEQLKKGLNELIDEVNKLKEN